jgi:hypothetical protein
VLQTFTCVSLDELATRACVPDGADGVKRTLSQLLNDQHIVDNIHVTFDEQTQLVTFTHVCDIGDKVQQRDAQRSQQLHKMVCVRVLVFIIYFKKSTQINDTLIIDDMLKRLDNEIRVDSNYVLRTSKVCDIYNFICEYLTLCSGCISWWRRWFGADVYGRRGFGRCYCTADTFRWQSIAYYAQFVNKFLF